MNQADADLITESFEQAAQRCEDLTPLVYERLFREQPQFRALFLLDTDDAMKGSMLEWSIRAILDLVDGDGFGRNVIRAEVVNHVRNGVSAVDFPVFFRTLADTMRQVLAEDWSPDFARAWAALLADLDATVAAVSA